MAATIAAAASAGGGNLCGNACCWLLLLAHSPLQPQRAEHARPALRQPHRPELQSAALQWQALLLLVVALLLATPPPPPPSLPALSAGPAVVLVRRLRLRADGGVTCPLAAPCCAGAGAASVPAAAAGSEWNSSMLLSASGGEGWSAPRCRMTEVRARHSPSSSNTTPPPPRLACLLTGASGWQGCSGVVAGLGGLPPAPAAAHGCINHSTRRVRVTAEKQLPTPFLLTSGYGSDPQSQRAAAPHARPTWHGLCWSRRARRLAGAPGGRESGMGGNAKEGQPVCTG